MLLIKKLKKALPASRVESLPWFQNEIVLDPVKLHLQVLGASVVIMRQSKAQYISTSEMIEKVLAFNVSLTYVQET